jgi:hypothetical protein
MFQFLIIFGKGFGALTVMRIHDVVWIRTLYSLLHVYECFGGAFWVFLHGPLDDWSSRSRPNCLCRPFRLQVPYLRRPQFRILILYIFHALCHFVTNNVCTRARQYTALLFYIILWSEQKCVTGNVGLCFMQRPMDQSCLGRRSRWLTSQSAPWRRVGCSVSLILLYVHVV